MTSQSRRQLLQGGLAFVGLVLLAGCDPRSRETPTPVGMPRIGILSPDTPAPGPNASTATSALVAGLHDLGYVDGRNVALEYRWAEGREERLPELADELVRRSVAVILAVSAVAARAAKDATSTIPIVIGAANDPVAAGLVGSLARPGGNVTGLSLANPTLVAKRLELLKETAPASGRFAALVYAPSGTSDRDWSEVQSAAWTLGLDLDRFDVRSPADLPTAFSAMVVAGSDALLILPNRFFSRSFEPLVGLTVHHRLPSMSDSPSFAAAGGLMTYGANPADLYRRSATYVDKILKGAKPADLPVEQPTAFDFVLNLKTAQALGLTIPKSVLQQATEIIQ